MTKWEMVVELVPLAFRDGFLAEESAWQVVVMILKGRGGYRGIGIVKVIWKVVAAILNCRFTASVTYPNSLHRFGAGHSTGTVTLKVKLI